MAKFTALFIAALAFHAALAGPADQENPHVRGIKRRIQSVSNDAVNSVQSVQPENHQGKRALASVANDLSYNIQAAVYLLNHAILHIHGDHGQQNLKQVAEKLSDIAHTIQQSVDAEPGEVKNVLKSNVPSVVSEVDKLVQVANQHHQLDEQNQDNVSQELEDVLNILLDSIRLVQIRSEIQQQTHQQVKELIQQLTNDVTSDIQKITTSDEDTAHELAHEVRQLSSRLDKLVRRLQIEVHHHEGESRNVLQQVSIKLNEIRASLDGVVNSQQANVQARVTELKNQLKTNIHNVSAQIERLIQLDQSGNQTSQDAQDINNLVKNVVARSLAGAHHLHRQLQVIAGVSADN